MTVPDVNGDYPPTPQQQAVIDSLKDDILVEAGAGTGKTTTTVKRYTRLIEDGYEPREILVFTFTDKAAGELREKVRDARRKLAEKAGEENPQAFSMSTAWVGTFHAICSRILKAYPVEAGVDPGFGVINDVMAETTRNEAFSRALSQFRSDGRQKGQREEMVGLFTEKTLREAIFSTYDELRSRGIRKPRLPEFKDTPLPVDAIEYLKTNVTAIAGLPKASPKQAVLLERLEKLLTTDADQQLMSSDIAPLVFSSTKDQYVDFCEFLNQAVVDLAAHEEGDRIRRDLNELLILFSDRYAELKYEKSVVDYEDLQLMTLDLLRREHRIREAYRQRFREIMVDEFQDTNQLQLDLVRALRGEKTTLLTVGDEMQSIYGFRHADIELFRDRRKVDGIERLYLTDNFRSQPEVIAAVNAIGLELDEQVGDKRKAVESASRHDYQPLTVGRSDDAPASAELILTTREDWKGQDLGQLAPEIPEDVEVGKDLDHFNEAEALRVAHHLRQMVDEGKAAQGDITILLRAKTRADLYVNALKQVGLSPYLTGGKGFWKSREAVDLRALLSVIANPLEDDALLGCLTSPVCGVSTDALWLLRRAAPDYSPLWQTVLAATGRPLPEGGDEEALTRIPESDRKLLTEFVSVLGDLRDQAGTTPLDDFIDAAVTATGYDLANLIRDPSRIGMANVRRVASLANEFEVAEGRSLRGFLNWISLSAGLDSEASVATEEEESDVIRIMTVHAAKGLEFKVACVPDCGRKNTNRQDSPLILGRSATDDVFNFRVGLRLPRIEGEKICLYDWNDLAENSRLAAEDEELRLFHVALTRAEDCLIVSGVLPKNSPKGISESLPMITRIAKAFSLEAADPDSWPETVPRGDEPEAEIRVLKNLPTLEQAADLRASQSPLEVGEPLRFGPAPLHRPATVVFPNVPLSFTAFNEFTECPACFYAKRVLRLEDPGDDQGTPDVGPETQSLIKRDRATSFGSAVHDVLESLGKNKWPDVRPDSVARALERRGADPTGDLDRAMAMIEGFTRSELFEVVRLGPTSFESPLLLRLESVTIRGFADVLVAADLPLVLDYKTNNLTNKTPAQKMDDYTQQRNLYALAVARSRGVKEIETAFVFLERPNEPVIELMDAAMLDRAEKELKDSLRMITSGQFFGGPEASRQPCGSCWACDRLETQIVNAGEAAGSA